VNGGPTEEMCFLACIQTCWNTDLDFYFGYFCFFILFRSYQGVWCFCEQQLPATGETIETLH